MLEVNTAILCASVPALKPIFTWKRIREVRRPNQFKGRIRNPFEQDYDPSRKVSLGRKGSDASLYPDLEAFDLTQISASRSPPGSPKGTTHEVYIRPESVNSAREERREERRQEREEARFSMRREETFQVL